MTDQPPAVHQVGCERSDGTLNIHAASDTCDICKPAQHAESPAQETPGVDLEAIERDFEKHIRLLGRKEIAALIAEIRRLRAQAVPGGAKPHEACPCLHTTPCHERCTCINPVSSHGCRRCCSYGIKDQQRAKAEYLVKLAATEDAIRALVTRWRDQVEADKAEIERLRHSDEWELQQSLAYRYGRQVECADELEALLLVRPGAPQE